MSRELVRFGDISTDENENYLPFTNTEASYRTSETILDSGLEALEEEKNQLVIDLKRKLEEKSKLLGALVKSQQELVNLRSECDRDRTECTIESGKYSQTDQNMKSIKVKFDEKQQALKSFQANMKNLTLNEFNQSHEVAVEFKDANVEFRQILETLIGKTDENMLKDLVAEREALKNELNKFENLESTMEIEGDLNLTFKGEQEEISLKVKFLKAIYSDEIKLNEDKIASERKMFYF